MKFPCDFGFALRGFSAKRMAWLLVMISALLIPLHGCADYQGDAYLAGVALVAMLAALTLGWCTPRTDRRRFWPFALGFTVLAIHSLLQKL